jgi:hypothetical protein
MESRQVGAIAAAASNQFPYSKRRVHRVLLLRRLRDFPDFPPSHQLRRSKRRIHRVSSRAHVRRFCQGLRHSVALYDDMSLAQKYHVVFKRRCTSPGGESLSEAGRFRPSLKKATASGLRGWGLAVAFLREARNRPSSDKELPPGLVQRLLKTTWSFLASDMS